MLQGGKKRSPQLNANLHQYPLSRPDAFLKLDRTAAGRPRRCCRKARENRRVLRHPSHIERLSIVAPHRRRFRTKVINSR
jgi:hypothetical protein